MATEKTMTKTEKPFLSLQNLVKVYPNGEKAVYGFDLEIEKNEFIVIVGPSGCGKSTTLRMIAGLEDISDGEIYLEDELLNYKECKDRKMAIVFQSYALYPQMTVYDNIAFPLTINKYPMPVTDKILLADREIRKLLDTVTYKKFIGVLFNVFAEKNKAVAKTEEIANIFDIGYETAKLLYETFVPFKHKTLEELDGMEEAVRTGIFSRLNELVSREKENNAKKGISVDEDCRILDGDGKVKTEYRNYTPYEIKTRVYETADKLDLTPYLDKLPKELSGGQMQRVALGRAIVKNVPIFLMDEPLSNLDAKLRLTMRSEIVKLHNRINATTIYVTHDQTEAMTMATRIVVMSKGFIQQIGAPEEIYNRPDNIFVAKFIGSPAMNLFEMKYNREENCVEYDALKISLPNDFTDKYDKFYSEKSAEFENLLENFDDSAREQILKLLSVTGEYADKKVNKVVKRSIWAELKRSLKKAPEPDKFGFEKEICAEKAEKLKSYKENGRTLFIGIRPENVKIEKYNPKKPLKNGIVVKPTVCELLGGEYNVHFDFCHKNMVGKIEAKTKITTQDDIAVWFSSEDIYIFDPVTGEVIR